MTNKEKLTLKFLCLHCQKKKTYLISPHEICFALSKKYVLSTSEIDDIMVSLSRQNFIDFVVSDSKNGYFYCVNLKLAGQNFLFNERQKKRNFALLVLRSCFLATVSFLFGVLLKTIFKE